MVSHPIDILTFLRENGDLPKWVVDLLRERDTFRNKIMEIFEDFVEKKLHQQRQTLDTVEDFAWKSSKISYFTFLFIFSFFCFFSFHSFILSFSIFSICCFFFFLLLHLLFLFSFLFFFFFFFFFCFQNTLTWSKLLTNQLDIPGGEPSSTQKPRIPRHTLKIFQHTTEAQPPPEQPSTYTRANTKPGPRWTGVGSGPFEGDFAFLFFNSLFSFSIFILRKGCSSFSLFLYFFHICFTACISIRVKLWMFPPLSVPWRCVQTTKGGIAGIRLGRLLGREHASTPQSGVEAPRPQIVLLLTANNCWPSRA